MQKPADNQAGKNPPPTQADGEDTFGHPPLQPDTGVAKRIADHFNIMYGVGPEAESNYQKSLAGLRRQSREHVNYLVLLYEQANPQAYAERMSALQTLADMVAPEALDPLLRFAAEDLPLRDTARQGEGISPYNEEAVLRITAIDGIARLSTTEDAALKAMPGFFRHQDPVIRLEAMNRFADAIRTVPDADRRALMIRLLPADYPFERQPRHPEVPGVDIPDRKPSGKGKNQKQ